MARTSCVPLISMCVNFAKDCLIRRVVLRRDEYFFVRGFNSSNRRSERGILRLPLIIPVLNLITRACYYGREGLALSFTGAAQRETYRWLVFPSLPIESGFFLLLLPLILFEEPRCCWWSGRGGGGVWQLSQRWKFARGRREIRLQSAASWVPRLSRNSLWVRGNFGCMNESSNET